MFFGENKAQKYPEQSSAEDAREHDSGDCLGVHALRKFAGEGRTAESVGTWDESQVPSSKEGSRDCRMENHYPVPRSRLLYARRERPCDSRACIGGDSRWPISRGMLREVSCDDKTGENSRPTIGEDSTPAHNGQLIEGSLAPKAIEGGVRRRV